MPALSVCTHLRFLRNLEQAPVEDAEDDVGVDGLGKVLLSGPGDDDVVLLGNGLYPLDLLVL